VRVSEGQEPVEGKRRAAAIGDNFISSFRIVHDIHIYTSLSAPSQERDFELVSIRTPKNKLGNFLLNPSTITYKTAFAHRNARTTATRPSVDYGVITLHRYKYTRTVIITRFTIFVLHS